MLGSLVSQGVVVRITEKGVQIMKDFVSKVTEFEFCRKVRAVF